MSARGDDQTRPDGAAGQPSGTAPEPAEPLSEEQRNRAAQFLTTEHFTLQTARAATIADSASRASLFMSAVSGAIIALALVAQMSQAGAAFLAFALLLFPPLFFLGVVTFQRVLQSAIADHVYARGINRIRHFYIETVPQTRQYYILSGHDDAVGAVSGQKVSRWQWFLTTAGTIMVINSVLLGVLTGLAARAFLDTPLVWQVLGGLLAFGVSLTLHYLYQDGQWSAALSRLPAAFPSDLELSRLGDQAARTER